MKIDFLYFDGCPSYKVALRNLEEVIEELGVKAEIERINIEDNEMANEHKFFGSPTIRINGKDVDPSAEETTTYRRGCRIYITEEGIKGVPTKEMIKKAILGAG